MSNENTKGTGTIGQGYRPNLSFYHPNPKGTGCALKMNLHPAHDDEGGCIMVRMANQVSAAAQREGKINFARFDWENSICVKLDFNDLCKVLQVLRGECESIENGKGLYHRSRLASTRIVLRHLLEPIAGYSLEFYRTTTGASDSTHSHILINCAEALGLCEAISGSMSVIGFGLPIVAENRKEA